MYIEYSSLAELGIIFLLTGYYFINKSLAFRKAGQKLFSKIKEWMHYMAGALFVMIGLAAINSKLAVILVFIAFPAIHSSSELLFKILCPKRTTS